MSLTEGCMGGVGCMARRIYPIQRFRYLCFSLFQFHDMYSVFCMVQISEGANQADRSPGFAGLLPLECGAEINEGLGPSTRIAGNNPAFGENPGFDT